MHFYITGDTHKKFDRVETFCQDHHTTPDDVMIILGDSGINYWLSPKDEKLKERVNRIPVTFFCIHGNHEGRPWESPADYKLVSWHGGLVYKEEKYPNILFAKDGEIYDFNGKSVTGFSGSHRSSRMTRSKNLWSSSWKNRIGRLILFYLIPFRSKRSQLGLLSLERNRLPWIKGRKSGYKKFMIVWIFQNGMQDIIMWKQNLWGYGLCLKIMMRSVQKNNA